MPRRSAAFWLIVLLGALLAPGPSELLARTQPVRARHGMVVSQDALATRAGLEILREGGSAVDAAVATAFVLAVTHPVAGNIGGGGFLVVRTADGRAEAYDFREVAPLAATPDMFRPEGQYDRALHHDSHLAVGVPGTVAGLHLAWKEHGRLPWRRLLRPAVRLARRGFTVTDGLSRSLKEHLPGPRPHPATIAQFTRDGAPLEPGDTLRQRDLARTLARIAARGPAGFYEGRTAELIVREMEANGGILSAEDLKRYRPVRREPVRGTYRGAGIIGMPPPSSGGIAVIEILNILEGFDLAAAGFGSARAIHLSAEAMRRTFADRALHLGDPDFNPGMPVERLLSKEHAETLRASIRPDAASVSSPDRFDWPPEGEQTTHVSVVDAARNAVALTTTLEAFYGAKIVVPGGGFLLNNEMGDFNPVAGETTEEGRIGTPPNLVAPGKRMLSSMAPTIVTRDGRLLLVTGSREGRTIINTVVQTILNVVDFGMNAQEAVDAPRFHHQWLPDLLRYEERGFSPDTLALLEARGHALKAVRSQGTVHAILYDAEEDVLEGAVDRRLPDGAAAGY